MAEYVRITGLNEALVKFAYAQEAVKRAAYRAINKVAQTGRTQAARDIRQRYMLPAAYINKHLTVKLATPNKLEAVIRAQHRDVLLSRYDAKQITKAAKRAKGDSSRGIPRGRKQAGVSFQVLRLGGRIRIGRFFLIPLRAGRIDGGNGIGIAIREGAGRNNFKVLHTISVDQMFRYHRPAYIAQLTQAVDAAFIKQLAYELRS